SESVLAITAKRVPQNVIVMDVGAELSYAKGEMAAYERALGSAVASRNPAVRQRGMLLRADLALERGHVGDYLRLTAKWRHERDPKDPGLDDAIDASLFDVLLLGKGQRALARLDSAFARVPLRTVPVMQRS